jgi:hypothetical protein
LVSNIIGSTLSCGWSRIGCQEYLELREIEKRLDRTAYCGTVYCGTVYYGTAYCGTSQFTVLKNIIKLIK